MPATSVPASLAARSRSVTASSILMPRAATSSREAAPTSTKRSSMVRAAESVPAGRVLRRWVDGVAVTPFT